MPRTISKNLELDYYSVDYDCDNCKFKQSSDSECEKAGGVWKFCPVCGKPL